MTRARGSMPRWGQRTADDGIAGIDRPGRAEAAAVAAGLEAVEPLAGAGRSPATSGRCRPGEVAGAGHGRQPGLRRPGPAGRRSCAARSPAPRWGSSPAPSWMKDDGRPVVDPVTARETSIRRPAGTPSRGITYCSSTPPRAAADLSVWLVDPPSDQSVTGNRRIDLQQHPGPVREAVQELVGVPAPGSAGRVQQLAEERAAGRGRVVRDPAAPVRPGRGPPSCTAAGSRPRPRRATTTVSVRRPGAAPRTLDLEFLDVARRRERHADPAGLRDRPRGRPRPRSRPGRRRPGCSGRRDPWSSAPSRSSTEQAEVAVAEIPVDGVRCGPAVVDHLALHVGQGLEVPLKVHHRREVLQRDELDDGVAHGAPVVAAGHAGASPRPRPWASVVKVMVVSVRVVVAHGAGTAASVRIETWYAVTQPSRSLPLQWKVRLK